MPSSLRHLFGVLLAYQNPNNLKEQLNRDQQIAYNTILNRVFPINQSFIDGPEEPVKLFVSCVAIYCETSRICCFSNNKFRVNLTSSVRSNNTFPL
ncbi:hypothetical protein H5410_039821 [Solanum commersonii]|uniref:Uncharacterized protein n=1 Tax=Solanum commersonii TaxID=4109 RepID=A0A9J5XM23_SOLCO|nr:hypothetical protein H5410_039821 [Solanum commersonii]